MVSAPRPRFRFTTVQVLTAISLVSFLAAFAYPMWRGANGQNAKWVPPAKSKPTKA